MTSWVVSGKVERAALYGLGIGGRILQRRKNLHLSQGALASLMGSPRTYISKVENGRSLPTIPTLERFASVLRCSVLDLLERCDAPSTEDAFMSSLMPYVKLLTRLQREEILLKAEKMVALRERMRQMQFTALTRMECKMQLATMHKPRISA